MAFKAAPHLASGPLEPQVPAAAASRPLVARLAACLLLAGAEQGSLPGQGRPWVTGACRTGPVHWPSVSGGLSELLCGHRALALCPGLRACCCVPRKPGAPVFQKEQCLWPGWQAGGCLQRGATAGAGLWLPEGAAGKGWSGLGAGGGLNSTSPVGGPPGGGGRGWGRCCCAPARGHMFLRGLQVWGCVSRAGGCAGCSWALHAGAQAQPPPCLPEVIQRVSRPESLAGCPFWDLLICLQSPGCSPPVSEGCGAEVPSWRLGSAPDPVGTVGVSEAPAWRWGCRILPAGGWLCHCGARGTGEHGGRVLGAGGPRWGSDPATVYGLLCSCFGGWRARMCAWRQPCIGGARSWSSGGGWCDWLPSLSRP